MSVTVERIGRVRPTRVEDGRGWWSLRAICDALRRSDYQAASALILPEHKRRWKDSPRDWKRKKAWCLIDRQGVERLVITDLLHLDVTMQLGICQQVFRKKVEKRSTILNGAEECYIE